MDKLKNLQKKLKRYTVANALPGELNLTFITSAIISSHLFPQIETFYQDEVIT